MPTNSSHFPKCLAFLCTSYSFLNHVNVCLEYEVVPFVILIEVNQGIIFVMLVQIML